MKRITKFLIISLVVFVIIGGSIAYFINKSQQAIDDMMEIQIEQLDLTNTIDGTYIGEYSAFPVSVIVHVTIVNHLITDIELVKHQNGQGEDAEVIIDDVVALQSLDLDLITGASYSSKAILLAINDAIK